MLVMCAGYLLVLAGARRLPMWLLASSIVLAHLLVLLGPPLISQDVFGYLAFARLGALHGLDPYTHVAAGASATPSSCSSAGRSSIPPMAPSTPSPATERRRSGPPAACGR